MQPETIKIDAVEYVRKDTLQLKADGIIRIVILQRGWIAVGYWSQQGPNCELAKASIIRNWGTTKGLGEIAFGGPVSGKTILDPTPTIRFHELTVIATIDCVREKWINKI